MLQDASDHDRVFQRHLTLELTEEAKEQLIDQGYNPEFGARPLRRAIQQLVEDPCSEDVLRGPYPEGSTVEVSWPKVCSEMVTRVAPAVVHLKVRVSPA